MESGIIFISILASLLLQVNGDPSSMIKSMAEVFLSVLERAEQNPAVDTSNYIATYENAAYPNNAEFREAVHEICKSLDEKHLQYEEIDAGCRIIYDYAQKRGIRVPARREFNQKRIDFLKFLDKLGEGLQGFAEPSKVLTTAMNTFIKDEWAVTKNAKRELEYCASLRDTQQWDSISPSLLPPKAHRYKLACEFLARKYQRSQSSTA